MSDAPLITDTELVTGHLAGDRAALAGIYDRYADMLYDVAAAMLRNRHDAADVTQDVFVIAAERLGQLRDPSRLKPWLLAVLRNEVYRRTGKRAKQVPTDFALVESEMTLPPTLANEAGDAEYRELAQLVREAAAGLDERDQLVLELAVRQQLDGDDLADALGVTPQQSYSLVHRMRQRTERSLGAFCVARQGRRDCPELAQILAGWDGRFSVLIRKRVARHIDDCTVCEHNRRKFVPLMLFGSAPAFAAPPELRDRVLAAAHAGPLGVSGTAPVGQPYGFTAPGGFPGPLAYSLKVALWWLLGAAAVMLAIGLGVFLFAGNVGADPQLAIDIPSTTTSTTTTTTTTVPGTTTSTSTSLPAVLPPVTNSTTTSTTQPESTTSTTRPLKTTTTTTTTTTTLPEPTPTPTPEPSPTPEPTPTPTPTPTPPPTPTPTPVPTPTPTPEPTPTPTPTPPPDTTPPSVSIEDFDYACQPNAVQLIIEVSGTDPSTPITFAGQATDQRTQQVVSFGFNGTTGTATGVYGVWTASVTATDAAGNTSAPATSTITTSDCG